MIRKFTPQDIDPIMTIWLATNTAAHAFIDARYWQNAYDTVKSLLPLADLFIWQDDRTIKGFIGITDGAYIAGLFVNAQYQSQGIGKALLDYAKTRYPRLELDVFTENAGAVRFYQRNGFAITQTKTSPDFAREEHRMAWPG